MVWVDVNSYLVQTYDILGKMVGNVSLDHDHVYDVTIDASRKQVFISGFDNKACK